MCVEDMRVWLSYLLAYRLALGRVVLRLASNSGKGFPGVAAAGGQAIPLVFLVGGLLSLAGIPPALGFFLKVQILLSLAGTRAA